MDRYLSNWYSKRIKQNRAIKNFLVKIINAHKEKDFPWANDELYCLNYEDLFEVAVAAVNKICEIVLGAGRDWDCGRDGKACIARLHNKGRQYSALISGCEHKNFILALVYEPIQDKFYFFAFPATLKEHTVPFEVNTGEPKRITSRGPNEMWKFECKSFEEMVLLNQPSIV